MKLLKSHWFILLLITLFAFGQRFYQIQTNPPALNWDEVSHGYNAFSILKTGADEWGTKLPLIFRAFGDYKLPFYIYLTTIPVFFLGLTSTAVRLVSVLAGTLAIPGIYLLATQLANSSNPRGWGAAAGKTPGVHRVAGAHKLALLSAFILAVLPWHFFISRPALEANLSLTLIIFGAYALLKALRNSKFYLLASLLLGLSLHSYNTARVFVPLLLIAFFFVYRKQVKIKPYLAASLVIFLVFLTPVIFQVLSGTGIARYSKLSILSDSAVFSIGQQRLTSSLPPPLSRLVHNRPVYFATQFIKNYCQYFSIKFFYQVQGAQSQFAIPGKNLLGLPINILSLIGGAYLIAKKRSRQTLLLFVWLLLSPVAAALTADPPQALRPNPFIPAYAILASHGFVWIVNLFKQKIWAQKAVALSLTLSLLLTFIRFLGTYYTDYQKFYSPAWQYGYQPTIEYIQSIKNNYDRIIFTKHYGEPHIFYAFYTKLNPQILQPGGDNLRFFQSDWYWTDRINNLYFVNDWDIPKTLVDTIPLESGGEVSIENSLLVVSPQSLPENAKVLETINFLDNSPAFIITTP